MPESRVIRKFYLYEGLFFGWGPDDTFRYARQVGKQCFFVFSIQGGFFESLIIKRVEEEGATICRGAENFFLNDGLDIG